MMQPYNPYENHYPRTECINDIASEVHPLGINFVRGVYLAYYFGQEDTQLTDHFAEVAAREPYILLPHERPEYVEAMRSVRSFFDDDGVGRLVHIASPEDEQVIQRKKALLERSRDQFMEHRPSAHTLQNAPPVLPRLRRRVFFNPKAELLLSEERDASAGELTDHVYQHLQFCHRMVSTDSAHVSKGRTKGTYQHEPHESIIRESILSSPRYTTGLASFNWEFSNLQRLMMTFARPQMKILRRKWEQHHRGENFMPDEALNVRKLGFFYRIGASAVFIAGNTRGHS